MSTLVLGSHSFSVTPDVNGQLVLINTSLGGVGQFSAAATGSRPAAGNTGNIFIDTTTLAIQRDNGTSWDTLSPNTGVTSLAATANQTTVSAATGAVTIGIANDPIIPGTGATTITNGTTAQRPGSPTTGMIRYNSTQLYPEIYYQGDWQPIFSNGDAGYNSNFDDFQTEAQSTTGTLTVTSISKLGWTVSQSNTASLASDTATGTTGTDRAIGVLQLDTGTNAAGRCGIGRGNNAMIFGNAYHFMEWRVWIPTLASVAQDYVAYFGFGDNYAVAGDVTDGAYFQYNRSSSTNWRFCTATGGTRTQTASTTAVAAGTWIKLGIEVNAAGTLVTFYINGTSVGTIATNIPTGATNQFGTIAKIEKTNGTTARQALLDYFSHFYVYTTPR